MADLATMRKRLDKLEREARSNPKVRHKLDAAKNLVAALEEGKPARTFAPGRPEAEVAAESFLLTAKPLLVRGQHRRGADRQAGASGGARRARSRKADGSGLVVLCGKIESELAGLSETKRASFAANSASSAAVSTSLAVAAYDLLGLMTFLTAGEKEVRAWTIERGTKAPAGGRQDSQRHRARLYPGRNRLVRRLRQVPHDGRAAALPACVRSEGKEYVMQEGDVVNFRFNV